MASSLSIVENTVRNFCRRLPQHADRDAIHGAALEGLVKAALAFNPKVGYWAGYAHARVMGAMLDEARRQDPNGRHTPAEKRQFQVSLEQRVAGDGDEGPVIGDTLATRDFSDALCERLDVARAIKTLDDRTRRVVLARAVGERGIDLAEELGVSPSRASQIETEGRRRLRQKVAA